MIIPVRTKKNSKRMEEKTERTAELQEVHYDS